MKRMAWRRKRVFAKFDDAEFEDAEHAYGGGAGGKPNGAGVIVAPFGKGGGQDINGGGGGLRRFGSLGAAAANVLRSSGSLGMQVILKPKPLILKPHSIAFPFILLGVAANVLYAPRAAGARR